MLETQIDDLFGNLKLFLKILVFFTEFWIHKLFFKHFGSIIDFHIHIQFPAM